MNILITVHDEGVPHVNIEIERERRDGLPTTHLLEMSIDSLIQASRTYAQRHQLDAALSQNWTEELPGGQSCAA